MTAEILGFPDLGVVMVSTPKGMDEDDACEAVEAAVASLGLTAVALSMRIEPEADFETADVWKVTVLGGGA